MLLQNRITIVHGGSGAVGSAVARAYAREGAEVHLTGRTRATLEDVAHSIRDEGGIAHVAVLDAVDRDATRLLLPRRPSYADVANAAVFAASDWATAMTATEINLTGGRCRRLTRGCRLDEHPQAHDSRRHQSTAAASVSSVPWAAMMARSASHEKVPKLKIVVREHVEVEGSNHPRRG